MCCKIDGGIVILIEESIAAVMSKDILEGCLNNILWMEFKKKNQNKQDNHFAKGFTYWPLNSQQVLDEQMCTKLA